MQSHWGTHTRGARRLSVFSYCAAILVGVLPAAGGTPTTTFIVDQVEAATYQHYLEDLLFTHLGDNRGFGPEHDLARDNIVTTLTSFGLSVELEPFQFSGSTYYNVVATQRGRDFPTEVIVLGAHFDSVSNPGADDNGTGTALVMEVARVLSAHRASRTMRYVLFDREEQGLVGSSAFVAAHNRDNIIMAVTADMVGHNSGAYGMDLYGRSSSASVVGGITSAIDAYGDGLSWVQNTGVFSFSDHHSFESAGIPACVIIEDCYSCNSRYHTPNDAVNFEPGYIDYAMVADLVRSVVGYLATEGGITLLGDADCDTDVDMADYALLQVCFGVDGDDTCDYFNIDGRGAINLDDYAEFQGVMTDPGL